MRFLIDLAKFSHILDSQGFTCIHWAAKRGDVEVLSQLLDCGAVLDTPASFDTQMRPIHWAASDGRLKSIKFLLDNRGDINALDGNSCSPLIIAAQYGRVETVIYLVKNGADLNQRDVNGDTALHWAAYKGYDEASFTHVLCRFCVELLLCVLPSARTDYILWCGVDVQLFCFSASVRIGTLSAWLDLLH